MYRSVHHVLTDVYRLNTNAFFNVRSVWVVRYFVREHLRLAECVDEGGTTSARGTF